MNRFALIVIGSMTLALSHSLSAATNDKAEEKPAWTLKLDEMKLPEAKAAGKIHGKDFVPDHAILQNGVLTLRQAGDLFPDLGIDVMMWIKRDEAPDGKVVRVAADETKGIPFVRYVWRKFSKKDLPQIQDTPKGYAMILQMGQRKDGKLTGQIYLCFPDESKSFVAGSFVVEEKK